MVMMGMDGRAVPMGPDTAGGWRRRRLCLHIRITYSSAFMLTERGVYGGSAVVFRKRIDDDALHGGGSWLV